MEQEFQQIYQTYAPELYYFILQMCRNEHLAFDYLKRVESKTISLEILPEPTEQNTFEQQISDTEQALQIHKVLHFLDEPY